MSSSRPSAFTFTHSGPYQLYSTAELLRLPPPEWLIDGIIPAGELVTLYAPPESYKSFIALDIALCVASDRNWLGRDTKHGLVIYVAGEGVSGLPKRLLAWHVKHNIEPEVPDIAWLTESLPIHSDSEALIALLARIENEVRRRPTLVIIDTMARCFEGEEEKPGDMSRFVAGVDLLRKRFGCTVLVIHHTRLDGTRERGNTALRGASRAMVAVDRPDGANYVNVKCSKQNDAEHFEDIELSFEGVDGTESGVMVLSNAGIDRARKDEDVLALLRAKPMRWTEWQVESGLDIKTWGQVANRIRKFCRKDETTGLWHVNT